MPVYSSLDTLKEGMNSGDYTQWKVYDQDENLMNTFKGLATTTANDAWTNLENFLNRMTGDGYVIVKMYLKTRQLGKGGDTANDLKYYYKLKSTQAVPGGGGGGDGISLGTHLALMQENMRLQTELAIKEIESKYSKKEVKDTSYFERVAEAMGKSFAKEYLKKEGIADGEEEEKPAPKQKPAPVAGTEPEKVKNAFQRSGVAISRIMKVGKQLGSDYDTVAESMEDMAELAEKNPLKLKQIMDALKDSE